MTGAEVDSVVYIVDDSREVRDSLVVLFATHGIRSHAFSSADEFLGECSPAVRGCTIVDIRMPEVSGFILHQRMREQGYTLPVIMVSGHGDVEMAVRALKAGALDFIQKPYRSRDMIRAVRHALEVDARDHVRRLQEETVLARLALLNDRERRILRLISEGLYNKVIADRLGLSISTVEANRKQIVRKLRAGSLYDLIRMDDLDRTRHRPRE